MFSYFPKVIQVNSRARLSLHACLALKFSVLSHYNVVLFLAKDLLFQEIDDYIIPLMSCLPSDK